MGLIVLAVVIVLIVPIISAVKIFDVGSKISDLEKSISGLKNEIISLDAAIRGGITRYDGAPFHDSGDSGVTEPTTPEYRFDEQTPEEIVSIGNPEAAEPLLQMEALPEIQRYPAETENREEEPRETLPPNGIPPRLPENHERYVPVYAEPAPSWFAVRSRELYSWLITEGNIWVTAGVMLFLAGFGLLFSYIHRKGWIPLEFRLAGAAAVGIAMTAFGWKLRELRRTYALILQGGGIGVLYIVFVAGVKLGPVIPVGGAVIGMLLLSAFTIVLAIYQEFEPLALFALLGGYAAPILVSTGSQNFVALFSIHSLLNFEVFLISLFRDWRKTRWAGLLASLVTGVAWGALRWRASYFASVEPFLILLFANYSAVALTPIFSDKLKNIVKDVRFRLYERADMPMIVTVPFVFLFLQMAAASHTRYGVALTCLALGAWYLALGKITTESERALETGCPNWIFPAYCIIFSNLAIPFVFRQASASAIWAAEGAFLIAFAVKRKKGGALALGFLLHAAAFVIYNYGPYLHLPAHLYEISVRPAGLLEWRDRTSPFLLTGLIFAAAALVSSYFISRAAAEPPPAVKIRGREFSMPRMSGMAHFFAAYGTVWWALSVWHAAFVAFGKSGVAAFSILCLGGAAGYALSSFPGWRANGAFGVSLPPLARNWSAARILAFPPLAVILLTSLPWPISVVPRYAIFDLGNMFLNDPWSNYAVNWPAFTVMFALGVLSYRSAVSTPLRVVTWGFLLFSFVSYTAVVWQFWVNAVFPRLWRGAGSAGDLVAFLPLCAATALLTLRRFDRAVAMRDWLKSSRAALCLLMLLKFPAFIESFNVVLVSSFSFYIPLLNTLELRQFLYLGTAAMLLDAAPDERVRRIGLRYVLPFAMFLLLNNIAARSALYYFGERVSWG
ncbi:MAG: DUF2339 domain-containing protein, partial [Synergistaceae bacterium]|nr:DUF2339 domain-containing protein [Synergistaceae bacterium]